MIDILALLKSTEAAAIASYNELGRGREKLADKLAVDAMRYYLNQIDMQGKIVIGEGERDMAPMLYIGEAVGTGVGLEIDIAVDPLEGTTILANAGAGALSVIAIAKRGSLLHAPDVYMDKIAIGFKFSEPLLDLNDSPIKNLTNVAKAKRISIDQLLVTILNRLRNTELIAKVREAGARVQLISDGDVAAIIALSTNGGGDLYMGSGGAPEGVLAASALKAIGGQMQGRLIMNSSDKDRALNMGIADINKQYTIDDLVKTRAIFIASGVTNGFILDGVQENNGRVTINSLITDSLNNKVTYIKNSYGLDQII